MQKVVDVTPTLDSAIEFALEVLSGGAKAYDRVDGHTLYGEARQFIRDLIELGIYRPEPVPPLQHRTPDGTRRTATEEGM